MEGRGKVGARRHGNAMTEPVAVMPSYLIQAWDISNGNGLKGVEVGETGNVPSAELTGSMRGQGVRVMYLGEIQCVLVQMQATYAKRVSVYERYQDVASLTGTSTTMEVKRLLEKCQVCNNEGQTLFRPSRSWSGRCPCSERQEWNLARGSPV